MLKVLSREEVHALVEAMPARYRGLVITAASTGLRTGELFGLTVDRVDFLRRTIGSTSSSSKSMAGAWRWEP